MMANVFQINWGNVLNHQVGYSGSTDQVTYDLNSDGLEDILAFGAVYPGSGPGTAPFRVYLQNPDGSFTADNPMVDGSDLLTTHPRNYAFADFNGDGISDIFIAAHGYDVDPFPGEQNRLLLGVGNGKFTDASFRLPQVQDFSHGAAAADIDRDGDIDIYVANTYGQNVEAPYFLVNDGHGNFSRDAARVPASVYNGIPNDERFMIADFSDLDGDGFQDLVLGGERINSRVYWGSASGGYSDASITTLPAPSTPIQQVHGFIDYDFNSDGRLDLLTQGVSELYQPGRIQILINDGGRGYIDQTDQYIKSSPLAQSEVFDVRMLDVNNDGALDLVRSDLLTADRPQDIIFWLNDGSNHFTSYTLANLGFSGEQIQGVYLAGDELRWLSALGVSPDGGFANYYTTGDALETLLPKAPMTGTAGPDVLSGGPGDDNIAGIGGDDTIIGSTGDDKVDGGTGFDTAVLPGSRDDYMFDMRADGLVANGPDGTDLFRNIESLRFADGEVTSITSLLAPQDPEGSNPIFRFFNTHAGVHFYTASEAEALDVMANLSAFRFEGASFRSAQDSGTDLLEVHRFFNTATGTHFYTASAEERDQVMANLPAYHYEGVAYQAHAADSGPQEEVYRFFNTQTGTHFYTPSEAERDHVEATLPQYAYEGIAYWTL